MFCRGISQHRHGRKELRRSKYVEHLRVYLTRKPEDLLETLFRCARVKVTSAAAHVSGSASLN